MKRLIEINGDGNCLFNSILLGYVDSHHGQYPVINGVVIRTQQLLRQEVQNYYQNILDGTNNELRQELIQTIRNELIGVILQGNFQGFTSNQNLLERLHNIRKIINVETDEGIRAVSILEQVNEELILDYVHSLNTIWGGESEINTLRRILDSSIRLSGHGNPQDNEIELMYVGRNHYNVYINNSDNVAVSEFVEQIGGSQSGIEKLSFTKKQISKIENLNENQFHLLLQIIFNKREAKHIDVNKSINGKEVDCAIEILNELSFVDMEVTKQSKKPCFVLNCPMYVPDDSSDDGYESDYSSIVLPEDFNPNKKDKYFITKKALDTVEIMSNDHIPDRNPKHVSKLIDKLRIDGFEEHDDHYHSNVGIVIGLNKPKSLSSKKNHYLDNELSSFQNTYREKVFGFRWQYKWMEKFQNKKGNDVNKQVEYEKVLKFYKQLKKYDLNIAKQFREENEMDVEIPYSLIRETIKTHSYTTEIIKYFQMQSHYVIYLSIIDSDTEQFNGVYSAYLRIVSQYNQPTIMSTGYIFSDDLEQHSEMQGIIPILSLGSQIDRLVRITTAREFPLGVYYPEPNFCILIPVGAETLNESFLDRDEKREAIAIIRQIQSRYGFSAVFIDDNPIITRIPDRAYYNRQTGEEFQFSEMFLQGIYARGAQEDFENLANIAQSHFGGNNWALSFIGADRPNDGRKAEARKSGLERLLNIYRAYQFQERTDNIDSLGTRAQLRDSGLSDEKINKIENTIEIATNAAYVFVIAPDIDLNEFLEFLHILLDFSYETKISKNNIRDFYIEYKDLFNMELLSNDNVARIARICGLEALESGNIKEDLLEDIEQHLDYVENNLESDNNSLAGDYIMDLLDDPDARNMEHISHNYFKQSEDDLFWSDCTRMENAKYMESYDQCPNEYYPEGFFGSDKESDSDNDNYCNNQDYDSEDQDSGEDSNESSNGSQEDSDDDSSQNSDSNTDESGNESIISYCLTHIIYDDPELIESLLYSNATRKKPSAAFLVGDYKYRSLSGNDTETINKFDFRDISTKESIFNIVWPNNYQFKATTFISTQAKNVLSYVIKYLQEIEITYLNPLSDVYKMIIQQGQIQEKLYIDSLSDALNNYEYQYDLSTSFIGAYLLYHEYIQTNHYDSKMYVQIYDYV